jgi:hypothetical protein
MVVSERRQLITLGLAVLVFMMTLFAHTVYGPRARVARVANRVTSSRA